MTEKQKLVARYQKKIDVEVPAFVSGKNRVRASITNEPDWEADDYLKAEVESIDEQIAYQNAKIPEYQEVVDLLSVVPSPAIAAAPAGE